MIFFIEPLKMPLSISFPFSEKFQFILERNQNKLKLLIANQIHVLYIFFLINENIHQLILIFYFVFSKKNYIRFFKAHTSIKSTFISEKIILLGIKKSVAHNNRAFLLKNMRKRNYNYGFFDPSLFSSF